jgi:secondary thiamine-phosphate synthase enzyme
MTNIIEVSTSRSTEFVDITSEIQEVVEKSGVKEGTAAVFTKHTTTAITINESESRLISDFEKALEKLAPKGAGYAHDSIDSNAHAHIRSIIIGPSETIPIKNGTLVLGTWQSIFLAEFDGPRSRTVYVQVVG